MNFKTPLNKLFLVLVISFILGITTAPFINSYFIYGLVTLSLFGLLFIQKNPLVTILSSLLFFGLGGFRKIIDLSRFQAQLQIIEQSQSTTQESVNKKRISFKVLSEFRQFEKTIVYKVKFQTLGKYKIQLTGLVYIPKTKAELSVGRQYLAVGKLQEITFKNTPYKNTYASYLAANNISHKLYCRDFTLLSKDDYSWQYQLSEQRKKLLHSVEPFFESSNVFSFWKAFVLGERSGIDKSIKKNFQDAGLMHILAISGLHIGILYQLLIFVFKSVFYLYKYRWLRTSSILIVLWVYVLFVGAPISAVRAAAMFSLFEISSKAHRNQHPLDILVLFVFVMALIEPMALSNVGFQLSVTAVASILIGYPLWENLWIPKNRFLKYVWQITGVSISAQLGLLPLLIYYFHQFPLLFLLGNIPVMCLIPILFLFSLGVLMISYFKSFMVLFSSVYSFLIQHLLEYIEWVASFESLILRNLRLNLVEVLFIYKMLIIILINYNYKPFQFWKIVLVLNVFLIYSISVSVYNRNHKALWVLEEAKNVYMVEKLANNVIIHASKGSISTDLKFMKYWSNEAFISEIYQRNLESNYTYSGGISIQIIDSPICTYDKNGIYVLTNNVKINLDRIIETCPKLVICTSNMKRYLKEHYANTCVANDIPFWDLQRNGALNLSEIINNNFTQTSH